MILNKVNTIMKTGINYFATVFSATPAVTQIHIRLKADKIVFQMAHNWVPKIEVTFKQIMQKPIDIFQYENLATPYLKKSLTMFAEDHKLEIDNVSAFIHQSSDGSLLISFYNKGSFQNQLPLNKQLEKLGITF